jgi:AcrR family transcriptional regulator
VPEPTADLIAAAESVLDRHGLGSITAELIAEAAGINRVTLYRRGHTPHTLLAAAARAAAAEFREASLAPLIHHGSAQQRLHLLLDALFDLADRHLALLAVLYDGPTVVFHLTDEGSGSPATRFEYSAPFERILQDGNTDGTLTSTDPAGDAELIFNVAGWTYVHLRRSHGKTPEAARTALRRLLEAYVQPTAVQS